MRIAVASEGLKVSPVFGKCASFTCYRIERGVIVECQNMPNPLFPPNRLASLLHELDVRGLITGTIQREAAEALRAVDIEVVPNRGGTAPHPAEVTLAPTPTGPARSADEELYVLSA